MLVDENKSFKFISVFYTNNIKQSLKFWEFQRNDLKSQRIFLMTFYKELKVSDIHDGKMLWKEITSYREILFEIGKDK